MPKHLGSTRSKETFAPEPSARTTWLHMSTSVRELQLALSDVQRKLKAAKRKHAVAQSLGSQTHKRCWWTAQVATMLLVLNDHDVSTAVEYLKLQRRTKRDAASWTGEEVQQLWDNMVPAVREILVHPDATPHPRALREAHKFMREKALHAWVGVQNETKGVAPTKQFMRRHFGFSHSVPMASSREDVYPSFAEKKIRSQYQWLSRWSRRWGMEEGVVAEGDALPISVRQEKARTSPKTKTDPKPGPKKRSKKWSSFCYQMYLRHHFRDHQMGHFSGPEKSQKFNRRPCFGRVRRGDGLLAVAQFLVCPLP